MALPYDNETRTSIREQQSRYSELLQTAKAAVLRLGTKGRALNVELLPVEKRIAPIFLFMTVSPAGTLTILSSPHFQDRPELKELGERLADEVKTVQRSIILTRQTLCAHGTPPVEPDTAVAPAKKRKQSQTNLLQRAVTQYFKATLQPKCDQEIEAILTERLAIGKFLQYLTMTVKHPALCMIRS